MQRSIASFFRPAAAGDGKTKGSARTAEKTEPAKSPLKPQNGTPEPDSPIKKTAKRSRRIADSDDDEPRGGETQGATPAPQAAAEQVSAPLFSHAWGAVSSNPAGGHSCCPLKFSPLQVTPVSAPPQPRTDSAPDVSSPSGSEGSPGSEGAVISPSGIPKRRTARKQFPKRKLEITEERRASPPEDAGPLESHSEKQGSSPVGGQPAGAAESDPSPGAEEGTGDIAEMKVEPGPGEARESEPSEDAGKKRLDATSKPAAPKAGAASPLQKPDDANAKTKMSARPAASRVKSPQADKKEGKKGEEVGAGKSVEPGKVEPAKSRAVSSFFTPKKAAVKLEKSDGEKPAVQTSPPESRETKGGSFFGKPAKSETAAGTPSDYNPSKSNYHPVEDACWSHEQRVPYLAVARTFEKIEEESARLKNIETLANLFRSVIALTPADLLPCLYLCLNRIGPAFLGLELGVGETVLMKAVAQATGRQLDKIKAESQEKGDLGLVAESSRSNQRMMFTPPKLTATGVFGKLTDIAKMTGNASTHKKIDIIKGLFVACRFSEARYIVRSLGGKLRIGLAEQSVLAALAQAVCLTPPGQEFPPKEVNAGKGMSPEARKAWIEERALILKQTYCELPNYDVIVPVLLKEGIEELPKHCKLTPGVPLKPMLAHPTRGIGEVMKRFDEATFTCEYKYDGERAQIHILENGEVHIYSRNQENNTSKYPDIISRIPQVKKEEVRSCILDAEAVAWDREKKQIQPFQVLTTRKRKDVDASDIKVQVCVYAFDLLYLNGESLVRQPLSKRRALLRESFTEREGEFMFACSLDSDNTDVIAEFLEQSVKDSCEGLMVKTLEKDATYEIAKRSHNWLKLKKDYLEGVGDTLDLAVIGAYIGKGKRTGTYGGFLLACYDEENEEYQSICKIGTGFKDEDLEQHFNFLKDHTLPSPRPYYRVDQSAEPDVWLEAVQVWEVKCADLSLSPVHKAAMGLADSDKGISLRFPRFLRIRDDKKPEEATTGAQVAELYRKQQQIQNQASGEKADLEDYY
uniref:DNA ligase n=1 Tax=Lepisosteus oculatus TaxID=7918 RepID=W5M103_LEPOC